MALPNFVEEQFVLKEGIFKGATVGKTPKHRVSLDRIDECRLVSLSAAAVAEDGPLETVSEVMQFAASSSSLYLNDRFLSWAVGNLLTAT